MLEKIEIGRGKSELVEMANSLKPQFNSTEDALKYYSQILEAICLKYGKTAQELFVIAENQVKYDFELIRVLSLTRTIHALKSLK